MLMTKRTTLLMLTGIAAAIVWALPVAPVSAEDVQSLRGGTAIDESKGAPEVGHQKVGKRFTRNYRQQPPLVPHQVWKYQIDLKANQCLGCHEWPQNVEENAPKVSETHYVSPAGKRLNKISGSRWFCTQCHVPQTDAEELVDSTFKSSNEIK